MNPQNVLKSCVLGSAYFVLDGYDTALWSSPLIAGRPDQDCMARYLKPLYLAILKACLG